MGRKKMGVTSGQLSIFEMMGLAEGAGEQDLAAESSVAFENLREEEEFAPEQAETGRLEKAPTEEQERHATEKAQREEWEWSGPEMQYKEEAFVREPQELPESPEPQEFPGSPEMQELQASSEPQELQEPQELTSTDLSMDWGDLLETGGAPEVQAKSISDGLILSLTTLGRVDIEYIASITGAECETVIETLRDSIYQNPDTWEERFYQGWETSDEYLSGNLKRKWAAAKAADEKYHGLFSENLKAIEKVLPPAVTAKDIYITLGSPWVPSDVIDDFILFLVGKTSWPYDLYCAGTRIHDSDYDTRHDEFTGTWEISSKTKATFKGSIRTTLNYGTPWMDALQILEKTLNMKTVAVTKEVPCPENKSGFKRVINKEETVLALEKQQKMVAAFQKWVWLDEERKKRLEAIFEEKFGCIRRRVFDGSFLNFPTLSPSVRLYPYQKDAVARILFSANTLLAHDVGSGKTYEMIVAGQELRRMGLSKKNLYVVPNNIVGQWENIFLTLYPGARLLCVGPKSFTPQKRQRILERMRDEEFDGIIIAYSCFEKIPLSREYQIETLQARKRAAFEVSRSLEKSTAALRKKQQALEDKLSELQYEPDDTAGLICFDQLGVTRLFVDEAHNFKNVPIDTKVNMVLGIRSAGSRKCQDMLDKVHLVQKQNGGGGVIFATGTPITNSITDAYIMQKYLQSGELALLELQSFDSWIGMFAERTTEFEIDVDTSTYRLATRFAKFHNLPELTALLSSIADFHQVDEQSGIPQMDGYQDTVVSKTRDFALYLAEISKRADRVRQGKVNRKDDNMLKITTDGRKAALDLRLVDQAAVSTWDSKAARCAENVAGIYRGTQPDQSTQLIFCDTSTPKAGFNLYDELKDRLMRLGVPGSEIAFIHDAATEAKRNALFAQMRSGKIRVLIGSTFKLGLGVNIQDRLIALHHRDVPRRPADMTQREGRILRQGNRNKRVFIYRYITQGSFDAYSWQLLETKQRFITGLLSGAMTERSGSDIEDTVLNYAEVKALAVGNPLIKERVEAANELAKYRTLQKKLVSARLGMEEELSQLPEKIGHQRDVIGRCERDLAFTIAQKQQDDAKKAAREELLKKARADVAVLKARLKEAQEAAQLDLLKDTGAATPEAPEKTAEAAPEETGAAAPEEARKETGAAAPEAPEKTAEEAPEGAVGAALEEALEKAEKMVQEILREKDEEASRRRQLREQIQNGVQEHLFAAEERQLLCYRGFEIVLPANMRKERPYLWLAREGRYHVELRNSEIWNMTRIDHVLDDLVGHLEKLERELARMETREAELKSALAKEESYAEQIELYREKVESLDKELGVNEQ